MPFSTPSEFALKPILLVKHLTPLQVNAHHATMDTLLLWKEPALKPLSPKPETSTVLNGILLDSFVSDVPLDPSSMDSDCAS